MASFVVFIERDRDAALPASLEILGQARRVATEVGATLYAVVALGKAPGETEDELIASLSRHGADKIVFAIDPLLGQEKTPRWGTHGPALASICEAKPPSLLLLADASGTRELAARVAARMNAAFICGGSFAASAEGVAIWQASSERDAARVGFDGALEFPVVATIAPGKYAIEHGDEEAEVEVLEVAVPHADVQHLPREGQS